MLTSIVAFVMQQLTMRTMVVNVCSAVRSPVIRVGLATLTVPGLFSISMSMNAGWSQPSPNSTEHLKHATLASLPRPTP